MRVGTRGQFRPYLKTFVPPFLPTRLTAPGSPRMVHHASLYVQGKRLFSTFLTRIEGSTDQSKKRLVRYQQEQFNLPREFSVSDSSQCIVNKMRRRRESQISNSLTRQNDTFARASPLLVHFSAVNCTTTRKNA